MLGLNHTLIKYHMIRRLSYYSILGATRILYIIHIPFEFIIRQGNLVID